MRALPIAILAAGIAAAACAPTPSDPSLVDELRILAVRAEPPEIAPGESVTLSALVADPYGAGRELTLGWALCIPDPLEGLAACEDPANAVPLGLGNDLTWTAPADALDGMTSEAAEVGLDAMVLLTVVAGAEPDQELIAGIKRVRVSTNTQPNTNPQIDGFDVDASVAVGSQIDLEVPTVAGSAQSLVSGEPERLQFSWLATSPQMGHPRSFGDEDGTGVNTWTRTGPEAVRLWVVVRDGRGGLSWAIADVDEDI